jgi:hypothetical protein
MKQAGDVVSYRPLWIVNAVLVTGNARSVNEVSSRPEVKRLALDQRIQFLEPDANTQPSSTPPAGLTWGLERIRAGHVWHGLGIDGRGVTIAIMDTGVDWSHPALAANYRGAPTGANAGHSANWFDAVEGSLEPIDPNGHGTHVAGTAAGAAGIGVAPGSNWMAARVLDANGTGTIGDIHLAFQWLLAPQDDPALSPDIINASWGGSESLLDFIPDIAALKAAGIIPIFSAGNFGPFPGSLTAPAAYPGTLAIGATDDTDTVAWFSSRGPSGLTGETKPVLVAPGTAILSSLPGSAYGHSMGTSMATPHAAGAFALLLSERPDMSEQELTGIFTATATALPGVAPNDGGWGRLDAYAALAAVAEAGSLRGQVMDSDRPLAAVLLTVTTPSGAELGFQSGVNGDFEARLLPGQYDLAVNHFGFQPYLAQALSVNQSGPANHEINLVPLPHGRVQGRLYDATSGLPVSGVVRAENTPIEAETDELGRFSMQLPEGDHELVASSQGHRLGRANIHIESGAEMAQDFTLDRGPRVLLLDSGQWYFDSQATYFATALGDGDYAHDRWEVRNPLSDVPTAEDLRGYDTILWSSPFDSPGRIGAGDALFTYLEEGGNLLISGQDVGEFDDTRIILQHWWHRQLRGQYLSPQDLPFEFSGEPGSVFEGMDLALNGPESAANQETPDRVRPAPDSQAAVAFRHLDGSAAALLAGQCEPFRIVYLGFGLEGVDGSLNRSTLVERSFAYFAEPETEAGIRFMSDPVDDFAPPGETLTYTVDVLNLSESLTDTISFGLAEADWPADLDTHSLTLGPCQRGSITMTVSVPAALEINTSEEFTLTAASTNFPEYSAANVFHFKTPGKLLLVDDDRWYDQSASFRAALAGAGYTYDHWEVGHNAAGRGSPSSALLNAYEMVVWFTAYDWFRPVTPAESESLHTYLVQGGRLFLSSQDYLYYHLRDPLTRDFLGVTSYAESISPTQIYGAEDLDLLGAPAGRLPLDFGPYFNFSDGLVPSAGARVAMWHDQGMAAGVANSGDGWRSVFLGFPFETLPADAQSTAMSRILGWLGDLGDSTFIVDERVGRLHPRPEARRSYTITVRNLEGGQPRAIALTNTLPAELTLDRNSILGGATFDRRAGQLTWRGMLPPGGSHTIQYWATPRPNLKAGARIDNVVAIHDMNNDLILEHLASIWVTAPDLGDSSLALSPSSALPGRHVTLELDLRNGASVDGVISATVWLPVGLEPLTSTLAADAGLATLEERRLRWHGPVPAGGQATVSLILATPHRAVAAEYQAMALIEDSVTAPLIRTAQFSLTPLRMYLPQFLMDAAPTSQYVADK